MESGQNGQKIILKEDEFRCEICEEVFKNWEAVVVNDDKDGVKVICAGCDFDRGVENYLDTYFPMKDTTKDTVEAEVKLYPLKCCKCGQTFTYSIEPDTGKSLCYSCDFPEYSNTKEQTKGHSHIFHE